VEALQDPELVNQGAFRSRYIAIIKDENNRLGGQVEKVLQAAALDKKEFKLKLETINVIDLIHGAQDHLELLVGKRGGSRKVQIDINDPYIEGDFFHLSNKIGRASCRES